MRWLLALAAVALLAGIAPAVSASIGTATVINGGNLRRAPQVSASNVVGQVCPDDAVTLLEQQGAWYRVRVETASQSCDPKRVAVGAEGWLSKSLLKLAGAAPKPTAAPRPTARPAGPTFANGRVDPPYWPCSKGQYKGNNNSGIYHGPTQRDYSKTYENVTCFDTAAAAAAAGFRAAKR